MCCGQRQTCLVHLLRDLEKVEHYRAANKDWPAFAKKLRRLLGDAIRLWKRDGVPEAEYASRRSRLSLRLQGLIEADWQNPDARRLIKRLRRHRDDLFTFLDIPGVPFENNHAEQAHSSSGNHPQEQLREPQRSWCGHPSGVDEYLPHVETARSSSDSKHHSRYRILFANRPTTAVAPPQITANS